MPESLAPRLERGLEAMALSLTAEQQGLLLDYILLLEKWNKAYNLTAVREPEKMLIQHIFDSLSVFSYVNAKSCLDVGAGAGLPGLVLAIAKPEQHWTLVDSNNKKTRFMQQATIELGLKNVNVLHTRIESLSICPELIISRAFASLVDYVKSCESLIEEHTELLAMKSQAVEQELEDLGNDFQHKIISLSYPEQDASRYLVKLSPKK